MHAIANNSAIGKLDKVMRATPVPIDWHPGLSIYASESFLKTVGDEYGWLGGFDNSGKLRCVLPYTFIRKAVFRMVRFRVETIALAGALEVEEGNSFLTSPVGNFPSIRPTLPIPPA